MSVMSHVISLCGRHVVLQQSRQFNLVILNKTGIDIDDPILRIQSYQHERVMNLRESDPMIPVCVCFDDHRLPLF